MSTVENKGPNEYGLKTQLNPSVQRTTTPTGFGEYMKSGLNAVANTAQVAAYAIPGGAVLSAAINGVRGLANGGNTTSVAGAPLTGTPTGAPAGAAGAVGTAGLPTGGTGVGGFGTTSQLEALAASGDRGAILAVANRDIAELSQSFNMQYLALQQTMQQENRAFTAVSNTMKVAHDAAKNAISNVK